MCKSDLSSMEVHDLVKMLVEAVTTFRDAYMPESQPAFLATWNAVWQEVGRRFTSDQDAFRGFLRGFQPILDQVESELRSLATRPVA